MWFAFVEGGLSLAGATRGKRTRSGKAKGVLGYVRLKQLVGKATSAGATATVCAGTSAFLRESNSFSEGICLSSSASTSFSRRLYLYDTVDGVGLSPNTP